MPCRQQLAQNNWQLAVCFVNSFVAVTLSDAWGGDSDTPAKAAIFVGGISAELRSASAQNLVARTAPFAIILSQICH